MIQSILTQITDPEEYRLALKVFTHGKEEFNEEERDGLVSLYGKFLSEVTDEKVRKALLLVDTTEGAEGIDEAALKELLAGRDLEVLKAIGEVIAGPASSVKRAKEAVSLVLEDEGNLCIRAALGRVALDKLAAQTPVAKYREEIGDLSLFLQACEDETLYQGSILVLEVKRKWKK